MFSFFFLFSPLPPFPRAMRVVRSVLIVLLRSVAVPVSSALFNHALRAGVEALDVPLSVKVAVVTDITNIARNVPAEYRAVVLNMLAAAVRRAFIFGLTCAALCIVLTLLIPWKAIRVTHPPIVRAGSRALFSRGALGKV